MKKKIIAYSLIFWGLLAGSATRIANAVMDLGELKDVSTVTVTPKFRPKLMTFCGHTFNYEQLITVPGYGAVSVLVEAVYPQGHHNVVFLEKCENGDRLYVLERCGC